MAKRPRARPVEIPFPVGGVDQSPRRPGQPPLTTPVAVNVRALAPIADRRGGGKRCGTRRAFTGRIVGILEPLYRITALSLLPLGSPDADPPEEPPPPDDDPEIPPDDDPPPPDDDPEIPPDDDPPPPDDPVFTPIFSEFVNNWTEAPVAKPAELGGDYVTIAHDGDGDAFGYYGHGVDSSDHLTLDAPGGTSGKPAQAVVAFNHYTTNDVTVTLAAHTDHSYSSGARWGGVDSCSGVGPFIRGSSGLKSYFTAQIVPTGVDTVKFRILLVEGGTYTQVAIGAEKTLLSGATVLETLAIRIWSEGGKVKASIDWPASLNGPNDWEEEIEYETNGLLLNRRGGIAMVFTEIEEDDDGDDTEEFRRVVQVAATLIRVSDPEPSQMIRGDYDNGQSFGLPGNWVSHYGDPSDTPVTAIGPFAAGLGDPVPVQPSVDVSNGVITGSAQASATGTPQFLIPALAPARRRAAVWMVNPGSESPADMGGLVSRAAEDLSAFLWVGLRREAHADTSVASGITRVIDEIRIHRYDADGEMVLDTLEDYEAIPFHVTDRVRMTDDGERIRLIVNGMVLWEYQTPNALLTGLAGNTRVGVALGHTNDTSTEPTLWEGGVSGAEAVYSYAGAYPLVLANTPGRVWVGNMGEDVWTAFPDGWTQPVPSVIPFGPHTGYTAPCWFGVDGQSSFRVIPDLLTPQVDPMSALTTDGTFPEGCRLCCAYQGRLVVAGHDGPGAPDASNGHLWYMSRMLAPYDWDFGADPIEGCAVAGTDPRLGHVADRIVALIPAGDDYLIFGCENTIYWMEGDPTYSGRVQVLTRRTGIIGPRAWCFDEHGTLYFVGGGDLWRFPRGGSVESAGRGRLFRKVARIDTERVLVQMAYDAFAGCVHLFLTPADSTIRGQHIVYDVAGDAFWFDEYPVAGGDNWPNMGPWSCCDLFGPRDQDRRILIGGHDGWIRRPMDTALGDDELRFKGPDSDTGVATGAMIASFYRSAPFGLGPHTESLVTALVAVGVDNNPPLALPVEPVRWYWLTGHSEAEVANKFADDATDDGEWFTEFESGRQEAYGLRAAAVTHTLLVRQISATGTWGLDSVSALIEPAGMARGR